MSHGTAVVYRPPLLALGLAMGDVGADRCGGLVGVHVSKIRWIANGLVAGGLLVSLAARGAPLTAADAITDSDVEAVDYWQGVCDGLRASGKYDAGLTLAVVSVSRDGESEYFACNGAVVPADTVADVTVFLHGGLR